MVKTIIFDFDGTIADTWKVIIQILKEKQEEWSLPEINQETIHDFRSKGAFELLNKYNVTLLKLPFIIPKAQKELGRKIEEVDLFPGIREVLEQLKKRNVKLGILTTNLRENVMSFLKHNKIEHFDFIHSEANLFGKGNALKKVIADNQLSLAQTMYVGDEIRDIEACRGVGIKIIAVTWGFNSKEILKKIKPDFLIDKPQQILKVTML